MKRLARIALALQLAAIAVLAVTQASASAQSPSPSATPTSPSDSASASASLGSPTSASSSPSSDASPSAASPSSTPAQSPGPAVTSSPTAVAEGLLGVTSESESLLTQVGEAIRYRVVVSNDGDAPLHDVFVVDLLPEEVTFFSAPLPQQVEAALYGKVGTQENITWNVGTLRPGQSITLPWTGTAASLGDMAALNAVRAEAAGMSRARGRDTTYVATSSTASGPNPSPRPTHKTVVTTRVVPAGATLGSAEASGEAIPLTGLDPSRALLVAVGLLAAGALLWWAAARPGRRRRICVALSVAALLTACTAGNHDAAAPRTTVSPQVKGKRIGRGQNGEAVETGAHNGGQKRDGQGRDGGTAERDGGGATPGTTVPSPAGGVTPAPAPSSVLVTSSEVVTVPAPLDPPLDLDSETGDNEVTYTWNHDSSAIGAAASSTRPGAPGPRLDTTVREGAGGTQAIASIVNTSATHPLVVRGRVLYSISGRGGAATLRSAPLDVTLNPRGVARVVFTYDLPSGTYFATSSFESD